MEIELLTIPPQPTVPLQNVGGTQNKEEKQQEDCEHKIAVCFSGGGIRSGCFSVGVLRKLIKDDYLDPKKKQKQIVEISSVSGGGYATGSLYSLLWTKKSPKDAVREMKKKFSSNTNYLSRTPLLFVRNMLLGATGMVSTILFFMSLAILFADFLWSEATFEFSDEYGNISKSLTNTTFPVLANTTHILQKSILESFRINTVLKDITTETYTSSLVFQTIPIIIFFSIAAAIMLIPIVYYLLDECFNCEIPKCLTCLTSVFPCIIQFLLLVFWGGCVVFIFEVYKFGLYVYARYLITYNDSFSNFLFISATSLYTTGGMCVSMYFSIKNTLPNSIAGLLLIIFLSFSLGVAVFILLMFIACHFSLWIIYKQLHPIPVDMFWDQCLLRVIIIIACCVVLVEIWFSSALSGTVRWVYRASLRDSFLERDFKFGSKQETIPQPNEIQSNQKDVNSESNTNSDSNQKETNPELIFTFNTCVNNLNVSEFQPFSFSTKVFGENGKEVQCKSAKETSKLPKVEPTVLDLKLSEVVAASAAAVSLQMGNIDRGARLLSPLVTFIFYIFNFNLGTWISLRNSVILKLARIFVIIVFGGIIGATLIVDSVISHDALFYIRFVTLCCLCGMFTFSKISNVFDFYGCGCSDPCILFLGECCSNFHIPLFKVANLLLLTKQSESMSDKFFITDGGHFDNLGLYWLLSKKQYRTIFCFDAGEDVKATLSSLNLCLQMAKKDGIIKNYKILEDIDNIIPKTRTITEQEEINKSFSYESSNEIAKTNHLVITVRNFDLPETTIYYGKSVLNGKEENELKLMVREQDEFPNHPTYNQNFTGTLFSHYYQLGKHVASCVLNRFESQIKQN